MLGERPRPPRTTGRAIGLGLVACFVALSLVVVSFQLVSGSSDSPKGANIGLICVILALCAIWMTRDRLFPARSPYGASSALDLADGVAEVERLRAVDALRVEEDEDLGVGYFLRLADDRILFLKGQYLDEPPFPSTEFELSRAPHARVVFGVSCRGSHLPPSRTIAPFTRSEYRGRRVPEDGQWIDASWEDVLAQWSSERRAGRLRAPEDS